MDNRLRYEDYDGIEILVNDTSNLNSEDFDKQMKEFEKFVLKENRKNLRVLSDIRGTSINTQSFNDLKKVASSTKPFVYKYAVVGVESAFHKVLFTAVKKFAVKYLESHKTIEAAKEWLSSN